MGRSFYFAGGGTGGHIYPGIAVAERIMELEPDARVHFFCSGREIDSRILGPTGFSYTALPAKGFSARPGRLIDFVRSYMESRRIAERVIAEGEPGAVIGVGGFVAPPACHAARRMAVPIKLVNVDIVPGKANRLIARWADEAFVQFAEAGLYFAKKGAKVREVGCPLRAGFDDPNGAEARAELSLDDDKKLLVVTGASSGAARVNEAMLMLLDRLGAYADQWQVVHLAGRANLKRVQAGYEGAAIGHRVLGYYDKMADLLAAADLVIGRSGAVSVAEYAAAGTAAICVPYPYHKDRHQYLNAGKLVETGAAVLVDDLADAQERAGWLWEELEELMKDDAKRKAMAEAAGRVGKRDAAQVIAAALLGK